jgi:hypothetical protein
VNNPNDSEDNSVHAGQHAAVATNKIEIGDKTTATILALSVLINVACFWWIFTSERETRLKEYNIDVIKTDDIAPLNAQVIEMEHEVQKVQLQLAVREGCNHGR